MEDSCHFGRYKRFITRCKPKTLKDGRFLRGYTTNPQMVNKIRKLSLTLNLNKPGEYDGGNLKFDFVHTLG